jgi:hypothetical protein
VWVAYQIHRYSASLLRKQGKKTSIRTLSVHFASARFADKKKNKKKWFFNRLLA